MERQNLLASRTGNGMGGLLNEANPRADAELLQAATIHDKNERFICSFLSYRHCLAAYIASFSHTAAIPQCATRLIGHLLARRTRKRGRMIFFIAPRVKSRLSPLRRRLSFQRA